MGLSDILAHSMFESAEQMAEMSARELLRKLKDNDCTELRQKGSHLQVKCGGCQSTVPVHGSKDIARGTLKSIEKSLGVCLGADWTKVESIEIAEEEDDFPDLPDDPWRYFKKVPDTILVPLSKLKTIRARPDGIQRAAVNMRKAYDGQGEKRKPISVQKNDDGTYTVLDGNSTTAVATRAKWKSLPAVPEEGASAHHEELEEAKKKGGGSDTLPEVVRKIGVFAKTQGGVIRAYAGRLNAKGGDAPRDAKEAVAKLQGLMDQVDAAVSQVAGLVAEVEKKLT